MKIQRTLFILSLLLISPLVALEFKHVGDYLLQSHFKLVGETATAIPMKPIAFRVYSDGITVRIHPESDSDSFTAFEIYRSDGIGQQRQAAGALEVVPGLQAMSQRDGTLRHLRLTQSSFTITTFPGVSDQTIVSHAIAATPKNTAASTQPIAP